ncbi:protein-S-isoprenylcysteine O-methyltransferase Ste14 [Rhodovulum bhavnagarense]|uniref:Protein-S-isoprenylcysteine O-methyltransferase Ste14 n=1 Tax=Rhodovulum bhavnagarense TaxID=992286 RepID=A0A4R2RHF9_9RHOB|nr:isoprenylcysteine carboxylmethyltransferase family protein [Rhodovulum bhavnagarense]TCP62423.1 protein-S-isoprenylcysteine O-methyltransferase Ste14 [Rhodovulum bhavnagarense]
MTRVLGWLIHRLELPPGWMMGLAAIAWAQAKVLPLHILGLFGDIAGGALVLAGLAVSGWAALHFVLERTSLIPRTKPNTLVTGGIYRFSRNPIYLADTAILLGLILYWDALLCLPLVPLYMKIIERRFIRREEAVLREHFGVEFEAYAARVRRWI